MGFVLFSPKGLMGLGEVILAPLFKKKKTAAMTTRVMPAMSREVPKHLRQNSL